MSKLHIVSAVTLACLLAFGSAEAGEAGPAKLRLRLPEMSAERGMTLFASKGCVVCHSVNGVGGHIARTLDAAGMGPDMNPFDFMAKMWRLAPVMIAAQEYELGGQIRFTGDEIADIMAFVYDEEQQRHFTETAIPARIKPLIDRPPGGLMPGKGEPRPGRKPEAGQN